MNVINVNVESTKKKKDIYLIYNCKLYFF